MIWNVQKCCHLVVPSGQSKVLGADRNKPAPGGLLPHSHFPFSHLFQFDMTAPPPAQHTPCSRVATNSCLNIIWEFGIFFLKRAQLLNALLNPSAYFGTLSSERALHGESGRRVSPVRGVLCGPAQSTGHEAWPCRLLPPTRAAPAGRFVHEARAGCRALPPASESSLANSVAVALNDSA